MGYYVRIETSDRFISTTQLVYNYKLDDFDPYAAEFQLPTFYVEYTLNITFKLITKLIY